VLKEAVSQDFLPWVFFIKNTPLVPVHGLELFRFNFAISYSYSIRIFVVSFFRKFDSEKGILRCKSF
jgi:hypothetical protein